MEKFEVQERTRKRSLNHRKVDYEHDYDYDYDHEHGLPRRSGM